MPSVMGNLTSVAFPGHRRRMLVRPHSSTHRHPRRIKVRERVRQAQRSLWQLAHIKDKGVQGGLTVEGTVHGLPVGREPRLDVMAWTGKIFVSLGIHAGISCGGDNDQA